MACCQPCSQQVLLPLASPAQQLPVALALWVLESSAALGQSPGGAAVGERSSQKLSLLQVLKVLAKIFRTQRCGSTTSVKALEQQLLPRDCDCERFELSEQGGSSRKQASTAPQPVLELWAAHFQVLAWRESQAELWVTCSSPRYRSAIHVPGLSPTTCKIFYLLLADSHAKKLEVLITAPLFHTDPLQAASSF